ncbi:MAG: PQQ-binding-like beta-propeller repeat protein [Hyphomicrobiaceae bacterium]
MDLLRTERLAALASVLALLSLAGCSGGMPSVADIAALNPFAEKQTPLPGTRVPVVLSEGATGSIELASADRPIALPPPRQNDSWPQPGGATTNAPGHLALPATIRTVWSVDVGQGSSKHGRLTASPVVADGRIFTLDAAGRVTALSTSGSVAWRTSLVPEKATDTNAFGGGLATEGGRLFVATGHGIVTALDMQGGKKVWDRNVGSPVRSAPSVGGGRVVVVTTDGRTVALSGHDGAELWTYRGLPERASLLLSASPAFGGDLAVVPYPSGDVVALRMADGTVAWQESLSRTRAASSLGSMSDAASPAIDGGTVFAIGHAGRMIATEVRTGERVWSVNVPGINLPYVAGDAVYIVDTGGQLIAMSRRDGKALWTTRLSGGKSWVGPVLAGGRLWLASDSGKLVGVNAAGGKVETQLDLGAPVYIAPIVANGRMYVLTDKARLISLH